MKLLLNTALITILGLGSAACTVVTDPSSGSSAGSSSSSSSMSREEQITQFANVNLERIKQDIAVGQGEYLASLATLLGIEAAQQPAFFAFTQERFTLLFPTDQTSAAQMLGALQSAMQTDQRFAQRLALH